MRKFGAVNTRRSSGLLLASVSALAVFAAGPAGLMEVVLVGPLTKEKILEAVPEWKQQMAAYSPKLDVVDKLHSLPQPVHLRVFLATWCPDCRLHVSAFFRLLEMVDNPSISLELIGVSKDKKEPADAVRDNNIERVPTFIVIMNGEEVGRIIETPRTSIEEDLLDIIQLGGNDSAYDVYLDFDFFRSNPHSDLDVDCTRCHLPRPLVPSVSSVSNP